MHILCNLNILNLLRENHNIYTITVSQVCDKRTAAYKVTLHSSTDMKAMSEMDKIMKWSRAISSNFQHTLNYEYWILNILHSLYIYLLYAKPTNIESIRIAFLFHVPDRIKAELLIRTWTTFLLKDLGYRICSRMHSIIFNLIWIKAGWPFFDYVFMVLRDASDKEYNMEISI